jgi:hypothetical protein
MRRSNSGCRSRYFGHRLLYRGSAPYIQLYGCGLVPAGTSIAIAIDGHPVAASAIRLDTPDIVTLELPSDHPSVASFAPDADPFLSPSTIDISIGHSQPLTDHALNRWVGVTATVGIDGFVQSSGPRTETFSIDSPTVHTACGETRSTFVAFSLPETAELISANATWTDLSQVRGTDARYSTEGRAIAALGTITGIDSAEIPVPLLPPIRQCFGGGQGRLRLSGTYSVVATQQQTRHVDLLIAFRPGTLSHDIPISDFATLSSLSVTLRHPCCAQELDAISASPPQDLVLSRRGLLRLARISETRYSLQLLVQQQ